MRPLVVASALAAVLASGCLAELGSGIDGSLDCSMDIERSIGVNREVLYPEAMGMDEPNPKVSVHARAGQAVAGTIVWTLAGGEAAVDFEGADGDVTTAVQSGQNVWQVVVNAAPGGNVTLGIDGDPLAFGVNVAVIQLVASGCTPREA